MAGLLQPPRSLLHLVTDYLASKPEVRVEGEVEFSIGFAKERCSQVVRTFSHDVVSQHGPSGH